MYSILLSAISILISIYTFNFTDLDGNIIHMNNFQGKKILLVNIATESPRVSQLSELQQLHNKYGDSLTIIAFPSNSFGHETKSNSEIKQFCQNNYGATFLIARKAVVAGTGVQEIYSWLANGNENEVGDIIIGADFKKILINKEGKIVGIFSPSVKPLDPLLTNSIINSN